MRVLNLGAGVQSTTIALMAREPEKYPFVGRIDYAIFADTQEEPKAVYHHLEWLKDQVPFPILVRSIGSLGDNLIEGVNSFKSGRFTSIPAFTARRVGVPESIGRRQCTSEYKIDVIEKTIRYELFCLKPGQRFPADADLTQIYGLSYDEAGRIARVRARKLDECAFPLFDMEMTRRSCVAWLAKQDIPHQVPRSACVFCPYRSNAEWRKVREVKEDWARAVEIDRAIRAFNPFQFVHRDCVPLEQADLDDPETKDRKRGQEMFSFVQECDGMCGV